MKTISNINSCLYDKKKPARGRARILTDSARKRHRKEVFGEL